MEFLQGLGNAREQREIESRTPRIFIENTAQIRLICVFVGIAWQILVAEFCKMN
jgi:hypothetical protein